MKDKVAKFLSARQVARRLGKSRTWIQAQIESGALRAFNLSENGVRPLWKISEADLQKFLDAHANSAPAPAVTRRKRQLAVTEYF
jgi:hypothetical protein